MESLKEGISGVKEVSNLEDEGMGASAGVAEA